MPTRTTLLAAAALLMIFGAAGNAFVIVPDLHGDLVELGVRRSVLGGTVQALYFSAMAMFACAAIVSTAAIQSARGVPPARVPLAVIAVIYAVDGAMAFSRSHNPHHLAPIVMGLLIAAAIVPARVGRLP